MSVVNRFDGRIAIGKKGWQTKVTRDEVLTELLNHLHSDPKCVTVDYAPDNDRTHVVIHREVYDEFGEHLDWEPLSFLIPGKPTELQPHRWAEA